MRASTMFALTLALLTGLGAVVVARYAGLLTRPEPPAKEAEVQVLVAARNVFPGDVIDPGWVRTRALRSDERAEYEKSKQEYLPPVAGAVALRVANKPIEADAPILRKDLKEISKPSALHTRLLPNMRAVNVSVEKDQSAGGLIQVGEWVYRSLTTTIKSGKEETVRTAPVAQSVRVIAKRNALWNVFAALPDNKPVYFTLEANPYRVALVEFSKAKGTLSLAPLSASEQKVLEDKRVRILAGPEPKTLPVAFHGESGEMSDEEERVETFNRGEYAVGHGDMMRIFNLATPPPPRADIVIEHFSGLARTQVSRYSADGHLISTDEKRRAGTSPAGSDPNGASSLGFNKPGCKTCKKKKPTP